MTGPLIYLVAGEPSGDLLGARLMLALRDLTGGTVSFAGIGGEAMAEAGLHSLFPQADLAIMGLAEVVPRIPEVLRRLGETVADIRERRPDAIVTIDSWGFTGRLLKRLGRSGWNGPRIHFVAPMVWAWRSRRVRQLVGRVDLLLCLLPNEPALFEKVGVRSLHVGHPVVESGADRGDGAAFRKRHQIPANATVVSVLPGSRHSEVSRLLPVFGETIKRVARKYPDLCVLMPTVETVAGDVTRATAIWPVRTIVVRGAAERYDAFAASRAALAASGTVAVELALAKVPTVMGYLMAPLTTFLAKRILKGPYYTLPNILTGREIMPELMLDNCIPDNLAPALERLIDDEDARAGQRAGFADAVEILAPQGEAPSVRAAHAVLNLIKEQGHDRG
jgi:lipid-A-disaccharide synthase